MNSQSTKLNLQPNQSLLSYFQDSLNQDMEDINLAALVVWLETQSGSSRSFPDLSEIVHRDLSRLMDIDGKMQKIVSDIKCLMGVARNQRLDVPMHEHELMVSGSTMEGCMLARWFKPKPGTEAVSEFAPALPHHGAHQHLFGEGYDAFRRSGSHEDYRNRVEARRNQRTSTETAAASLLEGLGVHRGDASNIARGLGVVFDALAHGGNTRNQPSQAATFGTIVSSLMREFTGGSPPARTGSTGLEMYCPNPEIEVDVMYVLASVPESIAREAIHTTRHGPAHVTVEYTQRLDELVQSLLRARGRDEDSSRAVTDGFLDPEKFKELASQHAAFKETEGNLAALLSLWFGVPVENISIDVKEHPSRASHQTELSIRITDDDRLAISVDHVPSIHMSFWPDVAKGFLTRKRKWPVSQHTIESITQRGCHLVPRPSADGDQRREFRWSFSNAEVMLTSLMTKSQRQVYMLFKILYYRYLKPLGDSMESYFAKTVMLWTAEEYPPSHPFWSNYGLLNAVHFLLLRLQVAFYRQKLPMFFIPEINLMEKLSEDISTKAFRTVTAVRKQLLLHIPVNLGAVVEVSEAWYSRLDSIYQVARPVVEAQGLEAAGAAMRFAAGRGNTDFPDIYRFFQRR